MAALFLAMLAPALFIAAVSLKLYVVFGDCGPRQGWRLLALALLLSAAAYYCGHAAAEV